LKKNEINTYCCSCGAFVALVDGNSDETTTKFILLPAKDKYEYKLTARSYGKQIGHAHAQRAFAAMQLLRASLHAASC